jgi:hypothetical protein
MLRPIKETDLNLLHLVSILETSKFRYDQSRFFHNVHFSPKCGSPSCALGHWWAAHGGMHGGIRWSEFFGFSIENRVDGPFVDSDLMPALKADFGITAEEACELFGGNGCGNADSAGQAADYIRQFVERRIAEREAAGQMELVL